MTVKKLVVIAVLVFSGWTASSSLAAGEDQDPGIKNGNTARTYTNAFAKWQKKHVRDYQMTVGVSCFCAGPNSATITVRNAKTVHVSAKPWYGPKSVTALFGIVAKAIIDEVHVLDVTYNRKLGYPRLVSIDGNSMIADDEVTYRVTGFKRLKP